MNILIKIFDIKNKTAVLSAILIIAFSLRLIFLFTIGNDLRWYDEKNYHSISVSIVEGEGFYSSFNPNSTTYWAPLQGYFLAAIYKIVGIYPVAGRLVQDFFVILMCYLIFWIGYRYFNYTVGIISSIIFAVHPLFIYSSNLLYPVTNFTLLSLLVFVFLSKDIESGEIKHLLFAGFFLGLSMLSKPVSIFFIPAILLAYIYRSKLKVQSVVRFFFVMVMSLVVISPWIYHNYQKYKKIYFITEEGAHSLVAVNNPDFKITNRQNIAIPGDIQSKVEDLDQDSRNQIYMEEALGFIFKSPLKFMKLYAQKFLLFWRLYPDTISTNQDTSKRNIIISFVFYGLLIPFSIFGMILSIKDMPQKLLLYGFIFGFAFGYALFLPSIRYRMPVEPYLILFAASGIYFLMSKYTPQLIKLNGRRGI